MSQTQMITPHMPPTTAGMGNYGYQWASAVYEILKDRIPQWSATDILHSNWLRMAPLLQCLGQLSLPPTMKQQNENQLSSLVIVTATMDVDCSNLHTDSGPKQLARFDLAA